MKLQHLKMEEILYKKMITQEIITEHMRKINRVQQWLNAMRNDIFIHTDRTKSDFKEN